MNKILFLAVVILMFSVSAVAGTGRNTDPGKQVLNSFRKDFPLVSDARWESFNNIYIASFKNNNRTQLAYYADNGGFIGQLWKEELIDLPQVVQEAFLKNAIPSDVKSIYRFMKDEGYPKYYGTILKDGKELLIEVDSYGVPSVIRKRKLPLIHH
jgi:hypothetical protein